MIKVVARALGWFSLGLGGIQLAAPRRLLDALGVHPRGAAVLITRLIGLRELTVVPGLLAGSRPFGWLGARVAGDLMDLGLLVRALNGRADRRRVAGALGLVAVVTGIDLAAAIAARREAKARSRHPDSIVRTVTVNRSVEELYGWWRNLDNLPRVMPHLEAVEDRGGSTSHWVARAPFGASVEWEAEIIEDRPNELLSWRSVEGSQVNNAGSVRFEPAPGRQGTEVTVEMAYEMPGGPLGSAVAKLTGEDPPQQVSDALRRFKQVMETGEPIRSESTAHGRKLFQRPARPTEEEPQEGRLAVATRTGGELA